jgi:hypothetical protein
MNDDTTPTPPDASPPRSRAEVFKALIYDRRLSLGAFKTWHLLRDYTNPRTGQCFPGRRRLATDLGSNFNSIQRWIGELTDAGWLTSTAKGSGFSMSYTLLDGQGQPLPKTATPTVAENGNTHHRCRKRQRSVAGSGIAALPKAVTKVMGTHKGSHRPISKGAPSVLAVPPLGAGTAATCAPKTSTTPTNHYTWT